MADEQSQRQEGTGRSLPPWNGSGPLVAERLEAVEDRLAAIEVRLGSLERGAAEVRRRQLASEVWNDPARHLAGLSDLRRVVREDLEDLMEVLSRWDVPLTSDEREDLSRATLVAQALSLSQGGTVNLVVEAVTEVDAATLERAARRARIITAHNRRAIPVVLSLEPPYPEAAVAAARSGIELSVAF